MTTVLPPDTRRPVVIAITGASGSVLGFELIRAILQLGHPVELIISSHSFPVISEEMQLTVPTGAEQAQTVLNHLGITDPETRGLLQCFHNKQLGAPSASGTHLTRGMAIIPCSMTTLAKVATGVSDNLVARAADVTLKERRPLVVVPRESPLNLIHLENMQRVHQAGGIIVPPVLSFYQEAFQSIEGQMAYTLGKVLDHLGLIQHDLFPRWKG